MNTNTGVQSPELYRHVKKPEWGLAVLTAVEETRKRFLFEDGQQRAIAHEYTHLMEPVQDAQNGMARLAQLTEERDLEAARARRAMASGNADKKLRTLPEQIEILVHKYEDFNTEKWQSAYRVREKRRLKRHRDPAIADAKEKLSPEVLSAAVEQGRHEEVFQDFVDLLEKTDLVSAKKDVVKLRAMSPDEKSRVIEAFTRWVCDFEGAENSLDGFDPWVDSLGEAASWGLATAPAALLFPIQLIPVNMNAFKKQAQWMAPNLRATKHPTARCYASLLSMAHTIFRRLLQSELNPQDMLDVHDFVVETLKPSAKVPPKTK